MAMVFGIKKRLSVMAIKYILALVGMVCRVLLRDLTDAFIGISAILAQVLQRRMVVKLKIRIQVLLPAQIPMAVILKYLLQDCATRMNLFLMNTAI